MKCKKNLYANFYWKKIYVYIKSGENRVKERIKQKPTKYIFYTCMLCCWVCKDIQYCIHEKPLKPMKTFEQLLVLNCVTIINHVLKYNDFFFRFGWMETPLTHSIWALLMIKICG